MTTLMNHVAEPIDVQTEYEPSVADKIQRIIYRLESGERLTTGSLKCGDHFCILGLFADESGLGEWEDHIYTENGSKLVTELSNNVSSYYNLHNRLGLFNIYDLPKDLRDIVDVFQPYRDDTFSLMAINDSVQIHENHNIDVNKLLADIIRSGAIFNKRR